VWILNILSNVLTCQSSQTGLCKPCRPCRRSFWAENPFRPSLSDPQGQRTLSPVRRVKAQRSLGVTVLSQSHPDSDGCSLVITPRFRCPLSRDECDAQLGQRLLIQVRVAKTTNDNPFTPIDLADFQSPLVREILNQFESLVQYFFLLCHSVAPSMFAHPVARLREPELYCSP